MVSVYVSNAFLNFLHIVANGTLDNDPMIEGMTLEYGNCEDYRAALVNRAASDDELGPMWVDDSIGALITALENQNALDNTIFLFQQDHGMETKVCTDLNLLNQHQHLFNIEICH